MRSVCIAFPLLLWLGTISAYGQRCVTLQSDLTGGCLNSACGIICARMEPSAMSTLDRLDPGFLAEERGSHLFVAKLTRGSLAKQSGLRRNDEIISVDGASVPLLGDSRIWQSGSVHVLRIKRGDQDLSVRLRAVPIRDLLANLPTLSNRLELTSLSSIHRSFEAAPYLSGLILSRRSSDYRVERVLVNSPAYKLGIMPGDYIRSNLATSTSTLERSDFRAVIPIAVVHDDREHRLELRFASLSDLLAN